MTLAKKLSETPIVTASCKNSTGADIAAGVAVIGNEDAITLPGNNQTDAIFGVTRSVIKNGTYGPVMIQGKVIATAGTAGITGGGARVGFEASTGLIVDWTAGKSLVGLARDAAAVTVQSEVWLTGPGATGQGT